MQQSRVLARQILGPGSSPQGGEIQPALLVDHVSHLELHRVRDHRRTGQSCEGGNRPLTFPAILEAPDVMSVRIFPSFTLNKGISCNIEREGGREANYKDNKN